MDNRDIQRLFAAAKYYNGDIDGDLGPKSMAAADALFANRYDELQAGHTSWEPRRRAVAAAQLILKHAGHPVGVIDGLSGPDTEFALTQWIYVQAHGTLPEAWRDGEEDDEDELPLSGWPRQTQSELVRFYGRAGGPQCTAGKVNLPFTMKIAWDLGQKINRFSCHEKVADSAERAYRKIASSYSAQDISRLGFDLFGGCYNYRVKRGGSTLSTHAFGIAIDTDPIRNQLKWGSDRAMLATPECKEYWRIWESEGWISLGRNRNYDWMHVQAARL